MKAVGKGPEDSSDLNLFCVKKVVDQETALREPRGCSTLSAIYTEMYVQTMYVQTMPYKRTLTRG